MASPRRCAIHRPDLLIISATSEETADRVTKLAPRCSRTCRSPAPCPGVRRPRLRRRVATPTITGIYLGEDAASAVQVVEQLLGGRAERRGPLSRLFARSSDQTGGRSRSIKVGRRPAGLQLYQHDLPAVPFHDRPLRERPRSVLGALDVHVGPDRQPPGAQRLTPRRAPRSRRRPARRSARRARPAARSAGSATCSCRTDASELMPDHQHVAVARGPAPASADARRGPGRTHRCS